LKNPTAVDEHIKKIILSQRSIKESLFQHSSEIRNQELDKLCAKHNLTRDKYYSAQNLEKYFEVSKFDCFSLFHGSHRLHFKEKYEILNLLPESHFIFKELQKIYNYKKIKKYSDFKTINALRNSICHFNSISYKIYDDEKNFHL
jgi:hypothetical protein